jgi:hypothetical protein
VNVGEGGYRGGRKGGEMSNHPSGRFRIVNDDMLRKKAERTDDPRHVFYEAMLSSGTYECYLARVGSVIVQPETTAYAVSGLMEIRYVRDRRGWIADA